MRHPHVTELADLVRGLLGAPRATQIEAHLASCPACRQASDQLTATTRLGRAEARYEPDNGTVARAAALFDPARFRVASRRRVRLAALVTFDSWQQQALAGVRGGPQADRHVTYHIGAWQVDVRLETPARETLAVTGQLSHTERPHRPLAGVAVRLLAGRKLLAATTLNAFGEFQLDCPQAAAPTALDFHTDLAAREHIDVPLPTMRPDGQAPPPSRQRRTRGSRQG